MKIKIKRGKNIDFPSQALMRFKGGVEYGEDPSTAGTTMSETGWSQLGVLNLPYALGTTNYKSYQQTTTEGVPLVYRCLISHPIHDDSGAAITVASGTLDADFASHIEFHGVQNVWPIKNAAVKWHAARKAMWKSTGITKRDLGSYTDAVRYFLGDPNGTVESTYLAPLCGDGSNVDYRAYTGGVWDQSEFSHDNDNQFKLKLLGNFLNEDTSQSVTYLSAIGSYLQSRINQREDTNLESSVNPAEASMIEAVFQLDRGAPEAVMERVTQEVQAQGDNPPYEHFNDPADVEHDLSEPVCLGRVTSSTGSSTGSAVVDIPFGMALVRGRATHNTSNLNDYKALFDVKVLNIYEMQG